MQFFKIHAQCADFALAGTDDSPLLWKGYDKLGLNC
jgi:hypothetical protein